MSRSWSSILIVGSQFHFGSELVLWELEAPSTGFRASLMWQTTANAVRLGFSLSIRLILLLAAGTVWLFYSKSGKAFATSIHTLIARRLFWSSPSLYERQLNPKQYAQSRQYNRAVKYHYQPLDSLKDEIRLVYILPGAGEDELCINLVHASLHKQPEYLALSYTWGNPHPFSPVVLNGFDFEVGSNLAAALRQLRRDRGPRRGLPYWIDAICINQADDVERSEQVGLMNRIYQKAAAVTIWLGEPSGETELAFAKMRALESFSADPSFEQDRPIKESPSSRLSTLPEARHDLSTDAHSDSLREWDAIIKIFDNPYFRRVWVAQEITSPFKHDVEFIGGRNMQRFRLTTTVWTAALIAQIYAIGTAHPISPDIHASIRAASRAFSVVHGFNTLRIIRYKLEASQVRRFIKATCLSLRITSMQSSKKALWRHEVIPLLDSFRGSLATDTRDKVYAAYAILKPHLPELCINYTMSTREVYQKVAYDAIKGMDDLRLLAYCQQDPTEFDLPSWVPDWRQHRQSDLFCDFRDTRRECIYHCSLNEPYHAHFDLPGGKITVQGLVVDRIKSVSKNSGPYNDGCHSEWNSMVSKLNAANVALAEAHWHTWRRTLVADCSASRPTLLFNPTWHDRLMDVVHGLTETMTAPKQTYSSRMEEFHIWVQRETGRGRTRYTYRRGAVARYLDEFSDRAWPDREQDKAQAEDRSLTEEVTRNRKFCITELGRMGLVPTSTEADDRIVVLFGMQTPVILRPLAPVSVDARPACYRLLGECFVSGLMDGEAIREMKMGDLHADDFVIV